MYHHHRRSDTSDTSVRPVAVLARALVHPVTVCPFSSYNIRFLPFSRHTRSSTIMATNVIILCIALAPACVIAFGKYSANIKVST